MFAKWSYHTKERIDLFGWPADTFVCYSYKFTIYIYSIDKNDAIYYFIITFNKADILSWVNVHFRRLSSSKIHSTACPDIPYGTVILSTWGPRNCKKREFFFLIFPYSWKSISFHILLAWSGILIYQAWQTHSIAKQSLCFKNEKIVEQISDGKRSNGSHMSFFFREMVLLMKVKNKKKKKR